MYQYRVWLLREPNHDFVAYGDHPFRNAPHVHEHFSMTDEQGIPRYFRILGVIHNASESGGGGEVYSVYQGTAGEFMGRYQESIKPPRPAPH